MLDSVAIKIEDFVSYSNEYFTKAQHKELRGQFGIFGMYTTRYTTHAKQCAKEGRYFPQVSIIERSKRKGGSMIPTSKHLLVQVSLPKLVFGTSIFDFDAKLIELGAQRISEALKEIDVEVSPANILDSIVTRVDFSKIVQIAPSYGTTDKMLKALAPYDMKQSSDFNRSHYHDGRDGFYMKFYNSSQGLVIYDKFDEIVANGKTNLEKEIASQYRQGKWTKGALRIELSLQRKQTVDGAMRRFAGSKKKSHTLVDVANNKVARACILDAYEKVYVNDFNRLVRLSGIKDNELLKIIDKYAKNYRDRALLYYLVHSVRKRGLKAVIEDMKQEVSTSTVTRYKSTVEAILGALEAKQDKVNPVSYLHRKLKTFRPVLPKKLDNLLKLRC
jgi:hypothetical protein